MTPPFLAAVSLANRLHSGQFRKDRFTPYAAHPCRVALIVRHIFDCPDESALAAAILHDVIEDTPADRQDVEACCGQEVAEIVAALTKDMRLPEDERERQYDAALATAPWQAKLIKLADVYDNFLDAPTAAGRESARGKARRAIAIASKEACCAGAVGCLEALLARISN